MAKSWKGGEREKGEMEGGGERGRETLAQWTLLSPPQNARDWGRQLFCSLPRDGGGVRRMPCHLAKLKTWHLLTALSTKLANQRNRSNSRVLEKAEDGEDAKTETAVS